jgi:hypothetical protein
VLGSEFIPQQCKKKNRKKEKKMGACHGKQAFLLLKVSKTLETTFPIAPELVMWYQSYRDSLRDQKWQ